MRGRRRAIARSPVADRRRGTEAALRRLAVRRLGEREGNAYADAATWAGVVLRLEPGELRVWDFDDGYGECQPATTTPSRSSPLAPQGGSESVGGAELRRNDRLSVGSPAAGRHPASSG